MPQKCRRRARGCAGKTTLILPERPEARPHRVRMQINTKRIPVLCPLHSCRVTSCLTEFPYGNGPAGGARLPTPPTLTRVGWRSWRNRRGLAVMDVSPPTLAVGSRVPRKLCILNSHLSSEPNSNTSIFQHYTILFNKLAPWVPIHQARPLGL